MKTKFIAIGGAHWDILGRAPSPMQLHDDVGGRVKRMIGGVAGPIAMKLGMVGEPVELICYAGRDEMGDALIAKLEEYKVGVSHILRGAHPTDVYMGIEAPNGLIAAIADCHSLEEVSLEAVEKLRTLAEQNCHVIIDGNLSEEALIALSRLDLPASNITLVPASPGKILRFHHFLGQNAAQLIVNIREAEILCDRKFDDSAAAAQGLMDRGFRAALVSNGAQMASFADADCLVSEVPPPVEVKRFTGAGDTLAAHFLHAQSQNQSIESALHAALIATRDFISYEDKDA